MTSSILPSIEARGYVFGIKVIVPDPSEASILYKNGFYGKPFGIRKPGPREYDEVLELSLVEAMYLVEKGMLRVYGENGKEFSTSELYKLAEKRIPSFKRLYTVYKDLRNRGLIVRSGLKFGSDYSIYRRGPGIDHAPFLVHVFEDSSEIDPVDIVRAGRLSHSVRKRFIMAIVSDSGVDYVSLKWFKP